MVEVSYVSDGEEAYSFKDMEARRLIEELSEKTSYIGITTTAISDGSTTNPITINGELVTAQKGNIVIYNDGQYLWTGTQWEKFGDLSSLGALAQKDNVSATYTPQGSVSVTLSKSTTEVTHITSSGSNSSVVYDSATETLEFQQGSQPQYTQGNVVSDVSVSSASFQGTEATIVSE